MIIISRKDKKKITNRHSKRAKVLSNNKKNTIINAFLHICCYIETRLKQKTPLLTTMWITVWITQKSYPQIHTLPFRSPAKRVINIVIIKFL